MRRASARSRKVSTHCSNVERLGCAEATLPETAVVAQAPSIAKQHLRVIGRRIRLLAGLNFQPLGHCRATLEWQQPAVSSINWAIFRLPPMRRSDFARPAALSDRFNATCAARWAETDPIFGCG